MNFQPGNIGNLPMIFTNDTELRNKINMLSLENIEISKIDWDSSETSWDFIKHPLLHYAQESTGCAIRIETAYNRWTYFANEKFYKLKANEEELNSIFIGIYGLQDEMKSKVELKDVTLIVNPYYDSGAETP